MRQEGWPAAPREAQPPLNGWRSDASTERGARGCRTTPPITKRQNDDRTRSAHRRSYQTASLAA
jgi:ribosome modulation factor